MDQSSAKEKRNTTQTAEDKIDRHTVYWTTSLRPLDPATKFLSTKKLAQKQKAKGGLNDTDEKDEEKERMNRLDTAVPPSFFDDDMLKWSNKFKTSRENRMQEKQKLKALGCFTPFGTKNANLTKM